MTSGSARLLTIDAQYIKPQFAASYLRIDQTAGDVELAFIDTSTSKSVPSLLGALAREGFSPEQVRWIIVTHVHLDHAGGAGVLAAHCKNAQILAHPRAVRHLVDPSRLEASARAVYGDQNFESLYGSKLEGIPSDRILAMEEGSEVEVGASRLRFLHTRGHANHHFCIDDPRLSTVYTGDSFGLRYPQFQNGGLFVFPSTSPTDFDGPEALKTIDKILSCERESFCPTHFGQVFEVKEAAEQLRVHLQFSIELINKAIAEFSPDDLSAKIYQEMIAHYQRYLNQWGQSFGSEEWRQIDLDLKLNTSGLVHCVRKTWEADNRQLS